MFGDIFIFDVRLPPPRTIIFLCITRESTQIGKLFGNSMGVIPPITMLVNFSLSSILANETLWVLNFF